MSVITATSTSILEGLRDQRNDLCWMEFCRRYQPPLIAFIRRLGFRQHDAEDIAQDTLLAFANGYRQGHYDREKGRLRTWLLGIAKNKVVDFHRERRLDAGVAGGTQALEIINAVPDRGELEATWEQEWESALLRACLEEAGRHVEPDTMRMFELYALKGVEVESVATQFGVTPAAVYKAKSRVVEIMSRIQKQMQDNW